MAQAEPGARHSLAAALQAEVAYADGMQCGTRARDAGQWIFDQKQAEGSSETAWYTEPGEISLLGEGIDAFFARGAGVVEASEEGPFRRVGLLLDGTGVEKITWRALDERGHWSRDQPIEVTWSEDDSHVARIDTPHPAEAVSLQLNGARLTFVQIETIVEKPEPQPLARTLPVERAVSRTPSSATPPNMITRAQWGARQTRVCGNAHNPIYLTIHHTATPNHDSISSPARMRQMQAFHIDTRGWCDYAYHYTVGTDGRLYEGRPVARTGGHVADWNDRNIGLSIVGNFTSFTPRQSALDTAEQTSRWLVNRFNIQTNRSRIRGHRDWPGHSTNACPGTRLYPWIDTLVGRLSGTAPPACENQCTAGARRCEGNGAQVCGDFNGNGCTAWSATQACGCGEECAAGSCERDPDVCCPAVIPGATGLFGDVLPGTWQADVAERMAELGVTAGCSASPMLFCPSCKLSRAQAAVFVARAMELPVQPIITPIFEDVPASSPYATSIEALYRAGIISGCSTSPKRFCPDRLMTRAESASLLARAGNLDTQASATPVFTDVAASHWARPAIETLHRSCVLDSCNSSPLSYCPDENIARIDFGRTLLDVLGLSTGDQARAPCCNPQPIANSDDVFADLPAGTPSTRAARALFDAGITAGCRASPRMFCGSCELDRAQAAWFIYAASGLAPITPPVATFSDVPVGHPAYTAVETLAAAGIISGCALSANAFCPDQALTRAQAAVLIAKALGMTPPQTAPESSFLDVSQNDWFGWQVESLRSMCVLDACDQSGQQYCPSRNIRRGELSLMIAKGFRVGEFAEHRCLTPIRRSVLR